MIYLDQIIFQIGLQLNFNIFNILVWFIQLRIIYLTPSIERSVTSLRYPFGMLNRGSNFVFTWCKNSRIVVKHLDFQLLH